jgi:predicted lipid-binding transport protein (Tim44 family)
MNFPDFGTLFFFIAAAVIFYQLRSVLGKRTGNERPPFDPFSDRKRAGSESEGGKVVSLPRRNAEAAEQSYGAINDVTKPGSDANNALRLIRDTDQAFDVKRFIDGAKLAYEMIVMAFDDGDKKTLKNLLASDVYEGFVKAIDDRLTRKEKIQSSFVGIEKAEIVDAELKGNEAFITLRLVSSMISATLDAGGKVIDGDSETVAEVKDVWTFSRDLRSRDPNWKLAATEAED